MNDLQEGVTGLRGKSYQVFAYYTPDGPTHFVKHQSSYYLPRLRLLRNLIIQFISDGKTDVILFDNLLKELKIDQDIRPALPEEIITTVSLSQLLLVLREQHQTQENMCKWVISAFGKLIDELESGRINYYHESDWEIRPLPGRRKQIDTPFVTGTELTEVKESVHENIQLLLNRMNYAISNNDPAGALHASASIFESLAKDIVGLQTVQNQSLRSFFSRYRQDSKLPNQLLDYIDEIYSQRNKTPLAGHGSLEEPDISLEQAEVLAAMTYAVVKIEYKLRKPRILE